MKGYYRRPSPAESSCYFRILLSSERRTENQIKVETSLSNTLSIALAATHCSIFRSHSHIFSSRLLLLSSIFMLSSVSFPSPPSLTAPLPLFTLSVSLFLALAGLWLGHCVPVNVDPISTCSGLQCPNARWPVLETQSDSKHTNSPG